MAAAFADGPPVDSLAVLTSLSSLGLVHPILASPGLASVGWPVLDRFRFGNAFAISPHGLLIAIGFMIGGWLLGRIGVRRGVPPEHVSTMPSGR